jgi:hypothetical protein
MKKIIFLLILSLYLNAQASGDSTIKKNYYAGTKYSVRADVNFMNVTGSTGFNGVGLNASGQFDYKINDKATIGVYGGHANDMATKDRYFIVGDKVFNFTTSQLTFFGLASGYTVWREGRFNVTPDIKLGLGYFQVDEINAGLNNSFKLKRSLLMVTPRLNFGFLIGKRLESGLSFSYLIPHSVNGDISHYELRNVSSGLFLKLHL